MSASDTLLVFPRPPVSAAAEALRGEVRTFLARELADRPAVRRADSWSGYDCQSASKRDPLSACKRGPPGGVALGLITGTDFALGLA